MRGDLINTCLPDKVQSLALQKAAVTVADLLYLTFQTYLPSEPSARVDGLADIEAQVLHVHLQKRFPSFDLGNRRS